MYGISGERTLTEFEVATLPEYQRSSPVRVGNAAAEQRQLDIYGEVLDAFLWSFGELGDERQGDFEMLRSLVKHLGTVWQKPDVERLLSSARTAQNPTRMVEKTYGTVRECER
jgi:GH15 family glucan-1,4-alpha-glucosidase